MKNSIKVQVFYTISAALNLFALLVSLIGICKDFGKNNLGMPSLVLWVVIFSSICQLIGICVYGGKGIADYSQFEADYSIIIASVALGVNFVSDIFFLVEIINFSKTSKPNR